MDVIPENGMGGATTIGCGAAGGGGGGGAWGGLLAQPAISAAMHAKALAKCQGLRGVVVLFIDLSVRWGRHTVPDFRSKSVLVGF